LVWRGFARRPQPYDEGVDLRALTVEDEPLLDGWMDEAASRFLGSRPSFGSPTEHPRSHGLVGLANGVPVGVVWFAFSTNDEAHASMLVAPDVRRRGVGRNLLRAALSATTALIIKADVLPGNAAAVSVLSAAGFSEMVPPDEVFPPEERDGRFFVWTRDGAPYEPRWG
jgi:GNAT superfamily N-acetyltransferase